MMLNKGHGRKVAQTLKNNSLPVSGSAMMNVLANTTTFSNFNAAKTFAESCDIGIHTCIIQYGGSSMALILKSDATNYIIFGFPVGVMSYQ